MRRKPSFAGAIVVNAVANRVAAAYRVANSALLGQKPNRLDRFRRIAAVADRAREGPKGDGKQS
jgi:hypothetical protein